MIGWKTFDRTPILDPIKYTKEFIGAHADKDIKIYIGCDSQNFSKKRFTGVVTVIAFHMGRNGVHYIYKVEKFKMIRDMFQRLWLEATRSVQIAETLRDSGILITRVDLDFNNDDEWDSNRLVAASEGFIKGLGYNVASKPNELVASRAADHIVRTYNWKREKVLLPIPNSW